MRAKLKRQIADVFGVREEEVVLDPLSGGNSFWVVADDYRYRWNDPDSRFNIIFSSRGPVNAWSISLLHRFSLGSYPSFDQRAVIEFGLLMGFSRTWTAEIVGYILTAHEQLEWSLDDEG